MNKFETLTIDNSGITVIELLKLAKETQLKITSKASQKYFNNQNSKKEQVFKNDYLKEWRKLEYIEYLIQKNEKEQK